MKKIFVLAASLFFISSMAISQETNKTDSLKVRKTTVIEVKKNEKPDVFIDGKKYDSEILDLLDPDKIAKVDVYKGESALEKFNSENVISVTTKDASAKKDGNRIMIRTSGKIDYDTNIMVIIDDTLSNKEALQKLSPDSILSISVVKGDKAIKEYNSESGVILIKTKKKE